MKRRRFSELLTLIKRIKGRMAAFAVFAVFPVLAFNAPAYAVLVGSYAFEEGSGTIIQDASGRGNNGALVNGKETSWTTGHSGLGLYFPGVTGSGSTHVNLGNPADFQLSNALTFTAWVYSENPNSDAPILAKEGNGVLSYWFGVFHNQFGVLLDHTGNYAWDLERRNVGTVPAKEWHHLAATWDGSVVHYFFDGVQLPNPPTTPTPCLTETRTSPSASTRTSTLPRFRERWMISTSTTTPSMRIKSKRI